MFSQKFHKLITKTLQWLVLTNHCRYCNELIGKDETLCEECRENLPVIEGEKCKYCGAEKSRCDCKKHKMGYDGITSPFYYENSIKKCIHNLKFNDKEFLADILAQDMANAVKKDFENVNFDLLCYVPFSVHQKIKRNYNQSELLARKLSNILNLPLKNVMVKLFETDSQHKMSIQKRKGNVFGVYDIEDNADIKGKTVLLVDDVKTSGATLDDCAWILKIRGAESVYCVTAALAGTKKNNVESKGLITLTEVG